MPPDDDTETASEVFDVDAAKEKVQSKEPAPLFRVFEGSKIVVSKAVGPMWEKKFRAAMKSHEAVRGIWDTVITYYNNNQTMSQQTPRGLFKRGDSTENIVFSNLNVVLPATYSKNPTFTCTTIDSDDKAFCRALEALENTIFARKDLLNAKPKIKKGVGMGLLTNFGVVKLDFTKKSDSIELANQEMERISEELSVAKTQEDVTRLYGELEALEMTMEVKKKNGFALGNVAPHNLIIDPYAEQPDGCDGNFMIEKVFLPTAMLNAAYTEKKPDSDERVLVYKPTHKAQFSEGGDSGLRDDGIGMVFHEIDRSANSQQNEIESARTQYLNMYHTECYYVWDKLMHRVLLFQRDDWTWPIWVWDDPLKITQFFPYFIFGFGMSTGGTVTVGETAYYLDQQDEINDINRQVSKIRRTVFDFFYYNSDAITKEEAEKFINGLRGQGGNTPIHMLGVKAGENKISDLIQCVAPPSAHFDKLFDKASIRDTVDRLTNTSDALRGVQFKTNTTEDAVNLYQDAMKIAVGAKVDVVEDVTQSIGVAIAEIAIQHYTPSEVAGFIGAKLAQGWRQMSLAEFYTSYSFTLVAGSTEKPNSVFRKKEAIDVAQAVGQFAQAAPGAVLRIMLRVLQEAFTNVVIKDDDWDKLDEEITATQQKGISTTGGGTGQPSAPQPNGNGGGGEGQPQQPAADPEQMKQALAALPPEVKQAAAQMQQQGIPSQTIIEILQVLAQAQQKGANPQQLQQLLQQTVQQMQGGGQQPPQGQQPQQAAPQQQQQPQG